MARFRTGAGALLVLCGLIAGCTTAPNDVAEGVGFQDYQQFQARQSQLRATQIAAATVVPPTAPMVARPPTTNAPQARVAEAEPVMPGPVVIEPPRTSIFARVAAALAGPSSPPDTATPQPQDTSVAASAAPVTGVQLASAPLAQATASNPDISDEQDFDAVAGRETIESDAERRARMQAQRVDLAPTTVPERPIASGATVINYAIATEHPVGQRVYGRSSANAARHQRNCQAFRSADLAQEWFLTNGGPERDQRSLDPDGDGYACAWDPAIYRAAAAAARG